MKTRRIAKKPERPRAVPESQHYFWTAEWQRGEREASADMAKGRVRSFNDVEALIEDLHRRRG